jgi:hypothetical protein
MIIDKFLRCLRVIKKASLREAFYFQEQASLYLTPESYSSLLTFLSSPSTMAILAAAERSEDGSAIISNTFQSFYYNHLVAVSISQSI